MPLQTYLVVVEESRLRRVAVPDKGTPAEAEAEVTARWETYYRHHAERASQWLGARVHLVAPMPADAAVPSATGGDRA